MNEEEIKSLINETVGGIKDEILSSVDAKNSGTAASIKRLVAAQLEPVSAQLESLQQQPATKTDEGKGDGEQKLSLKALQQQLTEVNDQLKTERQQREDQARAALQSEKQALLSGAIAKKQLVNGGILQDVLDKRWGEKLTKEGDQWFIQDGEAVRPFSDAFESFIGSDEGKTFLPPSPTTGSGGTEGQGSASSGGTEMTGDQALASAFGI